MIKKILCATDGSHSADKAVEYAVEMAKSMNTHLTFLTVTLVTGESASHSRFWDSAMLNAADQQLQTELQAAVQKAKRAGYEDISCVAAGGHNIAAAIIEYAERNGYDHIVTGSVGRTGVARMLLGSIAHDVISKAHCPVTVVR
jgi:nucleotide-binding universal stress UspA family protein